MNSEKKDTEGAFRWIVGLLQDHGIPFQISGGFAARLYGSTRELADIDIGIADNRMIDLLPEVSEFVTFGPERYVDQQWDLQLLTLKYQGQEIDIAGMTEIKIFDTVTNAWISASRDLSLSEMKEVYGTKVPVIPKATLIAYKKKLMREVDRLDIAALKESL